MSCIHFKFKSSLEYEKVSFDGLQLSLADLKEAILKTKKIGAANQYTLEVQDAQTKKVYENDDEMVPRNSSVVVRRVPLINAPKIPKTQLPDPSLPQPASVSSMVRSTAGGIPSTSLPALTSSSEVNQQPLSVEELVKKPDLSTGNATEEARIKAMMIQSADGYNPSQYVKFSGPRRGGGHTVGGVVNTKPPPPSYKCYRCGQPGHYINVCPTNGDPMYDNYRYKPVKGTPVSQLISVQGGVPEAMMDRHGNLVMRATDFQAYVDAQNKNKKPSENPQDLEVPAELKCHLCEQLVKDAVIIPCCGESFCYECIEKSLCDNDFTCPMCKAENVSTEKLAINKALRTAAKNFQLKVNELKSEAVARGFVKQVPPAVVQATTVKPTPPVAISQAPPPVLLKPPSPEPFEGTSSQPEPSPAEKDGPSVELQSTSAPKKPSSNGLVGLSTSGSVPVVKNEALAGLLSSAVLGGSSLMAMLPKNSTDLLAADLLLGGAKKSPSPPPMTAEEFYRQQKLLKLLSKKTGASRSNSPDSHSSWSDSDSSSADSRSPVKKKHKSHKSHKHSSRKHDLEKHRSSHRRKKDEKRRGGPSRSPDRKRTGEKHKKSKRRHRAEEVPQPQEAANNEDRDSASNSQSVDAPTVDNSVDIKDVNQVLDDASTTPDNKNSVEESEQVNGVSVEEGVDEDVCVDLHVDGTIDEIDSELAETTSTVATPTADQDDSNDDPGKEEGEISDSGQSNPSSPPTQRTITTSDQSTATLMACDQQEDLRAEIERAREKRKLESSQSEELESFKPPVKVPKVMPPTDENPASVAGPALGKSLGKPRVHKGKSHRKHHKVDYSSDDSSSSSSEDSEFERRKAHKSKRKSSNRKPEKKKHKSKDKKLKKSKSHSSSRSHGNSSRVKKAKKSSKH